MILINRARCLKCGDTVNSCHRHDFQGCRCGNVFVDGGRDYLRHGYQDAALYENLSVEDDRPESDQGKVGW